MTDDWDRRTITVMLEDFMVPDILRNDYYVDGTAKFHSLATGSTVQQYCKYITEEMGHHDGPELFGLDPNADVTHAMKEATSVLNALLSLQPKTAVSGGGRARHEQIEAMASEVLSKLPANVDVEIASIKYPVDYANRSA